MISQTNSYKRIWTGIIIALLLCLSYASCSSTPTKNTRTPTKNTNNTTVENFPTALPPSTPLLCPNDRENGGQDSFVGRDGTQFVYHGAPLKLYGYTFYHGQGPWHTWEFSQEIDRVLDMGAQIGQNMVRPTDYWDKHNYGLRPSDQNIWKNMDYLVCVTKQRHIFVELDVSGFAWFLLSQGYDPFDARNWIAFLDAIGKHYGNQPSIAFYSILGEASPPNSVDAMNRLVEFYRIVTDELSKADGGHHLIAAGGFNHMEEETLQIPWWHKIYSLPNNNIVEFKTYSQDDLHLIPTIAAFAKASGRPFVDEEFGMPQKLGDATYTGESYNNIRTSRAQFYEEVYSQGEENGVTGFVFWNMGCELAPGSYDVNPQTPATWSVIQEHAPLQPTAPPDREKSPC